MDQAISSLSLRGNPKDSRKALYLVSAPPRHTNVDLLKELGIYLKNLAPDAIIRSGDYPRDRGSMGVSVILSELSDAVKVRNYFAKTISLMSLMRQRQEGIESDYSILEGSLRDIPSLL